MFKITIREPERLVTIDRILTELEKIRLRKVFDINGVRYKDTLGSLFIDNREFYDDPKLFLWSYSDFIFDTVYFNNTINRFDSVKSINVMRHNSR